MVLKEEIQKLFYDRAPNSLVFEHISYAFPKVAEAELKKNLNELVEEGFLNQINYPNLHYPKFHRVGYHISREDLGEYPVETEIQVGDFKIPRFLDGDVGRAEDINTIAMSFEKVIAPQISQVKQQIKNESRKFWGQLITILSIFLTLFTLINVSVKPIYFSPELKLTPYEMLIQSICNLTPLAIIFCVFLLVLRRIFRRD